MVLQNYMRIGLQKIIEKHMVFFGANGILFNHESPRRGETFVTKKIVNALCKIKFGLQKNFI